MGLINPLEGDYVGEVKVGDIVGRRSYDCDVLFKVSGIKNEPEGNIITLKGISYRIEADAPENDLLIQSEQMIDDYSRRVDGFINRRSQRTRTTNHALGVHAKKFFFRSTSNDNTRAYKQAGKVLHLDGDESYLDRCLSEYGKSGIEVIGKYVPERDQPTQVAALLALYKPDILVLTGHDGVLKGEDNYLNIANYRNSKFYVDAVKAARKYESNFDNLIIFAGACQSMYSEIIKAGANFASSPYRVLIHALDPVKVSVKIALTSIDSMVDPRVVIENTVTGVKGIGGLQTRGKLRQGYPEEPFV